MIKLALMIAVCVCAVVAKPKKCFCPVEYNPVCGSNGRTYLSKCILDCALLREKVKMEKKGPCDPPPCTCPDDYKPVCGSNGVTYGNDCLLNCATADDSTLSVAKAGSCEHTVIIVDQPDCNCKGDFNPICGDDGVTYNNECLLKCSGQKLARKGPCEPPCACPNEDKPVCGSDGATYGNPCWLNCATKEDSSLRVANVGVCQPKEDTDEGTGILIVEQPECRACKSDAEAVCGKDRITYANECVMECAGVDLLKTGPCEPPCTCPADESPVCGTNKVTYGNVCLLNCATIDDSTLGVAHSGPCETRGDIGGGEIHVVEQPDCTCTRNFRPVCGTDGVTYNNECLMSCAGQSLAKEGSCEPPCTCPKEGKAVCGSNSQTYSNVCLLNCATKDDHTLRVNHPGPCKCAAHAIDARVNKS